MVLLPPGDKNNKSSLILISAFQYLGGGGNAKQTIFYPCLVFVTNHSSNFIQYKIFL